MNKKPQLCSTALTYDQDGDSCGGPDYQSITIKTMDAGGGHYLVIETDRWAINREDIDAFTDMLRRAIEQHEESHTNTS